MSIICPSSTLRHEIKTANKARPLSHCKGKGSLASCRTDTTTRTHLRELQPRGEAPGQAAEQQQPRRAPQPCTRVPQLLRARVPAQQRAPAVQAAHGGTGQPLPAPLAQGLWQGADS